MYWLTWTSLSDKFAGKDHIARQLRQLLQLQHDAVSEMLLDNFLDFIGERCDLGTRSRCCLTSNPKPIGTAVYVQTGNQPLWPA